MPKQTNSIPVPAIATMAVAVPLIAAGAIGLSGSDLVPALSKPSIAWSLIGVGVVMDIWASIQIVAFARERQKNS